MLIRLPSGDWVTDPRFVAAVVALPASSPPETMSTQPPRVLVHLKTGGVLLSACDSFKEACQVRDQIAEAIQADLDTAQQKLGDWQ